MPTTNGPNSMLIQDSPFDYAAYTSKIDMLLMVFIEDCQTKFGLTPRYGWIWEYFGGQNI
jgi:hypothetical protein